MLFMTRQESLSKATIGLVRISGFVPMTGGKYMLSMKVGLFRIHKEEMDPYPNRLKESRTDDLFTGP
jgi:hypothetical protein